MKHTDYIFSITIDGKEYPAAMTNGALLRFAEATGHDFGTPSTKSTPMRDNLAIIHACAESAAARNGESFPYTLQELADRTTPEDLASFADAMSRAMGESAHEGETKKKRSE